MHQPSLHQAMSRSLILLTGEQKDVSHQSRTKDNVDHAGLSQRLAPWKDKILKKLANSLASVNKILLTALQAMAITAVKVVLWTMPSNTSKQIKELILKQATHMWGRMEL